MRRPDPPLPSFALVMSRAANFDVSRLPPSRASFLERFHPYALVSPHRPQDTLMTTVDNRYREGAVSGESTPQAHSMASCEETHNNGSTDGEDLPAVGVGAHDCDCDCEAPGEERLKLACSKLAGALTELLDALRSRYLILATVRDFLAPGQLK